MRKNGQLTWVVIALTESLFLLSILISCNNGSQKPEIAQNNITDTIKQPDTTYLKDMETFKRRTADTIEANRKTIDEIKGKIKTASSDVRAEYEKTVDALEKKNKELQRKLDEYKAEGKEKWEKFKTDFSKDLDTLGKQIKDFRISK